MGRLRINIICMTGTNCNFSVLQNCLADQVLLCFTLGICNILCSVWFFVYFGDLKERLP